MLVRLASSITALLSLSAALGAQQVIVVQDPRGIDRAIAAAAPGDVLLLQPSVGYAPFTLNKGVTIRGNGAQIQVDPSWNTFEVRVEVPPGQLGVLEDLDMTRSRDPLSAGGVMVTVRDGGLRMIRCRMRAGAGAACNIVGGAVVLDGCSVSAANRAGFAVPLFARDATVAVRDGRFIGADADTTVGTAIRIAASPAIVAQRATLHIERTDLIGGSHETTLFAGVGAAALQVSESAVRVGDSTILAGTTRGAPATAIVNGGPLPVGIRDCRIVGGAPPTIGPIDLNSRHALLAVSTPFTIGGSTTLRPVGEPGAPFALLFADLAAPTAFPLVQDPLFATPGLTLLGGSLDATGRASVVISIPSSMALLHVPLFVQAVTGTSLPVRASTVAGGPIR